MRIMIRPYEAAVGSARLAAVDLAEAVADEGHDVLVVAAQGPLSDLARDRGLDLRIAPERRLSFDVRSARFVADQAAEFGADVVHNYEWPAAVEWALRGSRASGAASVTTVLSGSVPRFLPDDGPLIVGTRRLADAEAARRSAVRVMEPFVDTIADRPSRWASDRQATRSRLGCAADEVVIAVVGDLREGGENVDCALRAIEAACRLSSRMRVRLLLASDEEIAMSVASTAGVADATHRARTGDARGLVTVLTGVSDLRAVHDAADVTVGGGVSALRAMAFRTAVVAPCGDGFRTLADRGDVASHLAAGHTAAGRGSDELERVLAPLLADAEERARVGGIGRALVEERFSIDDAVQTLIGVYEDAVEANAAVAAASPRLLQGARAAWDAGRFRVAADADRRRTRGAA